MIHFKNETFTQHKINKQQKQKNNKQNKKI